MPIFETSEITRRLGEQYELRRGVWQHRERHQRDRDGAGPAPVAELNTPVRDAAPFLSPDEARLAFERDGDLYEASR